MSSKSLSLGALLAPLALCVGCQAELPAPSYPVPQDPPLEQTDLYPYFDDGAQEAPVEDDWVDTGEEWDLGPSEAEPEPDEGAGEPQRP